MREQKSNTDAFVQHLRNYTLGPERLLDNDQLRGLVDSKEPANPFEFGTGYRTYQRERAHVAETRFRELLERGGLDWNCIQEVTTTLLAALGPYGRPIRKAELLSAITQEIYRHEFGTFEDAGVTTAGCAVCRVPINSINQFTAHLARDVSSVLDGLFPEPPQANPL